MDRLGDGGSNVALYTQPVVASEYMVILVAREIVVEKCLVSFAKRIEMTAIY